MRTLCLILLSFASALGHAQENNTIVVRGNRSEKQNVKGPVRGTTVKPEQGTRFDLDSHYRDQASLLTVRTGAVKPSGFNIPRIRGQDARASEVFIDTFSVSSPYTGLPLVDELDLRAFDSVTIYQGLPALDVPSINPIGTLQLKFRPVIAPSLMAGSEVGKPHGTSYWGQVKDLHESDNTKVDARLYYRQHQSNGVYSFYSDEGTPYETKDDRIIDRKDNASESRNVVQSFGIESSGLALRYLGLLDSGEHGVPSIGGFDRTYASRRHNHHVHHASATKSFDGDAPLQSVSIYGSREDSKQASIDPEHLINPERNAPKLAVRSVNFGSRAGLQIADLEVVVDAAHASARVTQLTGDVVKREHEKVYLGMSWPVTNYFELMAKLMKDKLTNHASTEQAKAENDQEFNGYAAAIQLSPIEAVSAYLQVAKQERAPAMFEEFGDGGAVLPSDGLSAEKILHREVGITLKSNYASLICAYFQDRTDHKIIVLPSSTAGAWRAQNLDRTVVTGYELQGHAKLWRDASLRLSALRMDPKDKSDPHKDRQLPQLAKNHFAGEVTQTVKYVTVRWASRYRSSVYRDTRNSIRLDPLWMHDATADYQRKSSAGVYSFGAGLFNVLNTTSTGITAVESGEHGRTAVTEVRGYPLPGRHWKLYTALGF